MFRLGLTGSIGMGKSTTASMFAVRGVAVFDADEAVRRLYRGKAVAPIEEAFPGAAYRGEIDRARLAALVVDDPRALASLEGIVHPLVRECESVFAARSAIGGRRMAVFDVPLLFETGAAHHFDAVVVVTAPEGVQAARVLARPGMTNEKFKTLLARQLPDAEKRRLAHFIVDTGSGIPHAARQVDAILRALAGAP